MTKFRTTRLADQDIVDIYVDSAARFGEIQADRYFAGLKRTFAVLADNPRIARERREFAPPVRVHPYGVHLVVFCEDDAGILIVRVLHGRREWEDCLTEE
ncbi:MAG TPA: type II toxin-antitoxin system RelE/ParE family toxin [Saliniramus sp.]|nr:type II toxin-antitoxin system RelE/ParE family toxin [Saliniramus sp.]